MGRSVDNEAKIQIVERLQSIDKSTESNTIRKSPAKLPVSYENVRRLDEKG